MVNNKKTAADLYELKIDMYKKFDEKNHCLIRARIDPEFEYFNQWLDTNAVKHVDSGEKGFTHLDIALNSAAWTLDNYFRFASRWYVKPTAKDFIPLEIRNRPLDKKITPESLSKYVKRAAKFFGASLVGITELDHKWLYQDVKIRDYDESEQEQRITGLKNRIIPSNIKYAIVCAIEMDPTGISCAPTFLECASTALGYSKMAFTTAHLAEFIRNLGYTALPCQNDTALSIPMAIDAGLGALGKNGLLLTKEYGPRVRLCKVLTDLPLIPDSPDTKFIEEISEYCSKCTLCAEACENDAISFEKYPDYNTKSKSNSSHVKKWYVDGEKCFGYWVEVSGDCGNCINACPLSGTKNMDPDEFWEIK